ncbi:nucleoside hydrolase [Microbacteriaceae bacterium VKM Ac-2855]|nr:nucleoside hydrolase [Microbacteriaceae bacterium VKM Ac-2855]
MPAPASPFYFDCDTGIDDALALAYLLRSPEAEIVGIGTVSGNTDSTTAAANTLALLALAGRDDVPVAIGAHHFLAEEYAGGSPQVHGDNGFGNVALTAAAASVADEDAAALLHRLALAHPGALRVIAVGPLTNLAIALERYPDLPAMVHSVTIMGGSAQHPGNVTPVAEANIWHDPEAAAAVFAADWDVVMVGLDVTMTQRIEERHRDELLGSGDPLAVAIGQALDYYFAFYVPILGGRSAALHDPLAVAVALGTGGLRLAPIVPVEVDTTRGPGRGQTIVDLRTRYTGYVDAGLSRTAVALEVEDGFADALVARILGH